MSLEKIMKKSKIIGAGLGIILGCALGSYLGSYKATELIYMPSKNSEIKQLKQTNQELKEKVITYRTSNLKEILDEATPVIANTRPNKQIKDRNYFIKTNKVADMNLGIKISANEYNKLLKIDHEVKNNDYSRFIRPDKHIEKYAKLITENCKTNEESANKLLEIIQDMYSEIKISVEKSNTKELLKYPVETLVENNGSQKDLAILYMSLLKSKGIDFIGVKSGDHMSVGVAGNFKGNYIMHDGKKYFNAEVNYSLIPQITLEDIKGSKKENSYKPKYPDKKIGTIPFQGLYKKQIIK